MRTNKHPTDYEKPVIIIDTPVKLCPVDGHYLVAMPGSEGVAVCMLCRGVAFEWVMQSEAAEYRVSLSVEAADEKTA